MAYASKYYDPVKRHEYYMKHRKLKGRNSKRSSTASLNEDGKAAAAEVKEQIMAERKEIYSLVTKAVSDQIKQRRAEWKAQGLSSEQIKEKVQEIREMAKEYKKQIKAIFEEKYLSELDKIKQDPSFLKAKKSSKKK